MDELIIFIKYGIYKNTMYFPTTKKDTTEYLRNIMCLTEKIKKENTEQLIDLAKDSNIYISSIIVAAKKLNNITYNFISNKIKNEDDLTIFLWIYCYLNNNRYNKYLNKLYLEKHNYVKESAAKLFNIYTPSFAIKRKIYKRTKDVYKIRYMLESQINLDKLLKLIKDNNIDPLDLRIEMGYTYRNNQIKNEISLHFIKEFMSIDLIELIDKWYIDEIPRNVLNELDRQLNNFTSEGDYIRLKIISNTIEHKELEMLLMDRIEEYSLDKSDKNILFHYIPSIKDHYNFNSKYSYSLIGSSILTLFSKKYNTKIFYKNDEIDIELQNSIFTKQHNFSLDDKILDIEYDSGYIIYCSEKYNKNYNANWDMYSNKCPIYDDTNTQLLIIGKNKYLINSLLQYLNTIELENKEKSNIISE